MFLNLCQKGIEVDKWVQNWLNILESSWDAKQSSILSVGKATKSMSSLKVTVCIGADMSKNAAQIVFAAKNKENNEDQSF